jgi:hypothetical protein
MDWNLYRSIVDQSIAMGIRRYSAYLMNEPMLDRELPERVAYITARIQKPQYVKVTSHGGLFTKRMAQGLLDAGLHKLKISVQSLDPDAYRRIMGLPLEKTLKNIEISRVRQYWQERQIKLYVEPVENRAAQHNIRETAISAQKLQAFSWCRRLMEQIYILYDGRMLQCCADWEQQSVMGDLTRDRLSDLWYGRHYSNYRRRFADGDVKGMICACCQKQAKEAHSSTLKAQS